MGHMTKAYTFRDWHIPDYMMLSIKRYVKERKPVGKFLTAVICNNLHDACSFADDVNIHNLPAYMAYFYNETPWDCWGTPKKMKEWLKK